MTTCTDVANSQYTWPCGTPKSSNNAFTAHLSPQEPIKKLSKKERDKAYQAAYTKAHYIPAAERAAKVLIDNSKRHYVIANRVDSANSKDKTARIVGKSMPNWKNA